MENRPSSSLLPFSPPHRVVDAAEISRPFRLLNPLVLGRMLAQDVRELIRFKSALGYMVSSKLKIRYQRSMLGFLWALLNPLLMMTVLAIVFSTLMNRPIRTYAVYLFSGLLPWRFFQAAVKTGASCLCSNEKLLRRLYIPQLIFPTVDILTCLINTLLSMLALFLLLLGIGATINLQLVLFPVAVLTLLAFAMGMGLILMVLNTYFRDITHLIDVALRAWYFASPVLYEPERVTEKSEIGRVILMSNPMTHILGLFHCAFVAKGEGWPRWPDSTTWLGAIGSSLAVLLVGYMIYKAHEHRLIHRL